MGMGSIPCHAWTITLAGLKVICPTEVEQCEVAFQKCGYNWDSFAQGMDCDTFLGIPEDADPEDMVKAWEALQAAFQKATEIDGAHLELGIGYYSRDDGDRYDDLEDGCYFTVEGVMQLTPAGEKCQQHLEQKSWTVFG